MGPAMFLFVSAVKGTAEERLPSVPQRTALALPSSPGLWEQRTWSRTSHLPRCWPHLALGRAFPRPETPGRGHYERFYPGDPREHRPPAGTCGWGTVGDSVQSLCWEASQTLDSVHSPNPSVHQTPRRTEPQVCSA